MHIGGYMRVGVQRETGIGMPKYFRERLGIHAARQCVGCEGVAQVVESHLLALRSFEDLLEFAVDRVGISRLSFFDR